MGFNQACSVSQTFANIYDSRAGPRVNGFWRSGYLNSHFKFQQLVQAWNAMGLVLERLSVFYDGQLESLQYTAAAVEALGTDQMVMTSFGGSFSVPSN